MDRQLSRPSSVAEPPLLPTRRATLHSLTAVQLSAQQLRAATDRVLARCLVGTLDGTALVEEMHSIDRSASLIRYEVARLAGHQDSWR